MAHDSTVALQTVLLIAELERAGVMDEVRHSLRITPIGHDAGMPVVQHDIATAPLPYFFQVRREVLRMRVQKTLRFGVRLKSIAASGTEIA